MTRHPLRALARERRGAALVEFAFVLAPFLLLLMGTLDLGYQAYLRALASGALERAAREATVGNRTQAQVVALIRSEVNTIVPANLRSDPTTVVITPLSYFNFSAVGGGERITGDTAPVGAYNSTDCYEDRNNNGRYDATNGGGGDLGTADDIVYYDVTVTVPRLFPLAKMFRMAPNTTVNARTLIRNQPFGQQQVRIRCA